jgi:histidinol phosphatase-like enzyme
LLLRINQALQEVFFTEEDLDNIHKELKKNLRYKDIELIDDIFYSPYHIEGIIEKFKIDSADRKPNIGMILSASAKYNINLSESFFIGDSYADMKCAENAGLKKILVKTGYGSETLLKCEKDNVHIDFVAEDLNEASDFITKQTKFSTNN